ncbi:MAG: class I SAM-dependent methyltransferase [Myxococcota bacterium]|jgi:ubiquinone/menaquinone biosynthesis C-methylase UbiE
MSEGKKQSEKDYHESFYQRDEPLPEITVEGVERNLLRPCYEGNGDHYSENRGAFHQLIRRYGGWEGKRVLDYACGFGDFAVYYGLTGAARVDGFDIAETAIELARERVERQGLADRVHLEPMDASALRYEDDSFDLLIGHGVIHHVIKYPHIFEEMHRVLRPGARAFFVEGLADFPLWKLHWKIKGEVPEGDVPIFASEIREKAAHFSDVHVEGDTFFHSAKRWIWRAKPGPLRRGILRTTHGIDRALFRVFPPLRRWGSFSYLVLTK